MDTLSPPDDLYRFFGLDHPAFGPVAAPEQMFRSGRTDPVVREILAGAAVLSIRGSAGAGKTAFMHVLAGEIHASGVHVAIAGAGASTPWDVHALIAQSCGEDDTSLPAELMLRTAWREGGLKRLVLLCDDADTLSADTFRYLWSLLKVHLAQPVKVQLVLLGEMGDWAGLDAPDLAEFRQATTKSYTTLSLRKNEAAAYLEHRFKYAGQTLGRVMAPSAVSELTDLAHCNPRRLDELAQQALIYGYQTGRRRLTRRSVRRAVLSTGGLAAAPAARRGLPLAGAVCAGIVLVGGATWWFGFPGTTQQAPQIVAHVAQPAGEVRAMPPAMAKIAAAPAPPAASPTIVLAPAPARIVAKAETAPLLTTPPPPSRRAAMSDPAPGLVLVAGPHDNMPTLYARVYRGVTPPPYSAVLAVNQAPIKPGSLVIFPDPPEGWGQRR